MQQITRPRVAVTGATGYAGMQCVRLLERHPHADLVQVVARAAAGRRYCEVVPGGSALVVRDEVDCGGADVILSAMPHGVAAVRAPAWLAGGAVLFDLSADFRLRDPATLERWYGTHHPSPGLLDEAVYALPELPGTSLDGSAVIFAMPGCHATAVLLALIPALEGSLVEGDIVVDGKTGISGAGRSPSLDVHFAEVNESVRAYAVPGHRHGAEIAQALAAIGGAASQVTFVPHLVPMTRGILVTAYLRLRSGRSFEDVVGAYREFCSAHRCLRWSETPPATKAVAGTNLAALSVGVQGDVVVVTCAIDNLLKGAAGQAVQAFNLRYGFEETAGLPLRASWP